MYNYCGGSIVFEYPKDNFWKLNIPLGYQKNPMTTSSIKAGKCGCTANTAGSATLRKGATGSEWMGLQRYPAKSQNPENHCKYPKSRGFYHWWKLEEDWEQMGKRKRFSQAPYCRWVQKSVLRQQTVLLWSSTLSSLKASSRETLPGQSATLREKLFIWNQTAGQEQWRQRGVSDIKGGRWGQSSKGNRSQKTLWKYILWCNVKPAKLTETLG